MYIVHYSKKFKKSIDKLKHSGIKRIVLDEIQEVILLLSAGGILPLKYRDHVLQGDYIGNRECHIRPDLLIIYRIEQDELVLLLLDIGSHSYLFG